jgi:hypothetical protein
MNLKGEENSINFLSDSSYNAHYLEITGEILAFSLKKASKKLSDEQSMQVISY